MYKTLVRALVRHGFARINAGDPGFLLRMAAPDAVLCFPGDNSWARMFRPVVKGRDPHGTHVGIDEPPVPGLRRSVC
jgi:ketosteroid isomerase-like protein